MNTTITISTAIVYSIIADDVNNEHQEKIDQFMSNYADNTVFASNYELDEDDTIEALCAVTGQYTTCAYVTAYTSQYN